MIRSTLAHLALPWFRHELPGWGRAYSLLVGGPDTDRWSNARQRIIPGKMHGYRMRLNLSNWSERSAYFVGRFYDLDSQLLYQLLIDEGDQVLDVGANIGMMALLAARRVGPNGRVDCVEPNPVCIERLRDHFAINHIETCHLHQCGASDQPGELTLRVLTEHTGMGSLADIPPDQQRHVTAQFPVRVVRVDEIVAQLPTPPRLIKMDVEGFELRAVRGLNHTLTNHHPILLIEFIESHLARAGASRAELTAELTSLGYLGFITGLERKNLRYQLKLRRLHPGAPPADGTDTLWVHPQDDRLDRLTPFLQD